MSGCCVSDLFVPERLSPGRLADAVRLAAPRAWSNCGQRWAPASPRALCAELAQCLPQALGVGIPELMLRAWLPRQTGPGPWPAPLEVRWQALLEWIAGGLPSAPLRLGLWLELDQPAAWVAATGAGLCCGEPRAWRASLRLSIADAAAPWTPDGACFYEHRAEIHLPAGPWML